jgi:hypothetical protein
MYVRGIVPEGSAPRITENQGASGRGIGDSDLNTKQFDHAKGGGPGGA